MQQPLEVEDPTCYDLESKASMIGWRRVRNKLLEVVTENAATPLSSLMRQTPRVNSEGSGRCPPICIKLPQEYLVYTYTSSGVWASIHLWFCGIVYLCEIPL